MSAMPASKPESISLPPPADKGPRKRRQGQSLIANGLLNPPVKWAGGKRWVVPQVGTIWKQREHKRYVEPFCGGLAMALGLKPDRALLNDINPHLIHFYSQVQRGLKVTIEMTNDE